MSAERKAENILVSIGAADGKAAEGALLLLPLFASRKVAVGRGGCAPLGDLHQHRARYRPSRPMEGKAIQLAISTANFKNFPSIVVLLQAGSIVGPGTVLGAARAKFISSPRGKVAGACARTILLGPSAILLPAVSPLLRWVFSAEFSLSCNAPLFLDH